MPSPPKSSPPERPARAREAGIGQLGGFAVSTLTAVLVFYAGRTWLMPPATKAPAPTAPQVAAPPPASPTPPPPSVPEAATDAAMADAAAADAASADATSADATAANTPAAEAGAAIRPGTTTATPVAAAPTPAGATAPEGQKPTSTESQEDKDLARESWRRNKPDLSVSGSKASILIPIKGSSADGAYKFIRRTRTVVITLPNATSLNTMHFYKLKRDGFHALWTDQPEKDAKPSDGTKLRLVLAVPADPVVEMSDDFVRVTIARPEAKPAPAAEAPETPDEGTGEEKE